jgi:hypothetical protein
MKQCLLMILLCVLGFSANAGGSAVITCGSSPPGVYNTGEPPIAHINYTPGESGPGLFYVGIETPDKSRRAFRTGDVWTNDNGGLMPFHSRYDGGMPPSIYLKMPFPGSGLTTNPYVGYQLGAGHGVFTDEAGSKIDQRLAIVARTKNAHDIGKTIKSPEGIDYARLQRERMKNNSNSNKAGNINGIGGKVSNSVKKNNATGAGEGCTNDYVAVATGSVVCTESGSENTEEVTFTTKSPGELLLEQMREAAKNGHIHLSPEAAAYRNQQRSFTRSPRGTSPTDPESLNYAQALIQADMVDNKKYVHLMTIPFIDCGVAGDK